MSLYELSVRKLFEVGYSNSGWFKKYVTVRG